MEELISFRSYVILQFAGRSTIAVASENPSGETEMEGDSIEKEEDSVLKGRDFEIFKFSALSLIE